MEKMEENKVLWEKEKMESDKREKMKREDELENRRDFERDIRQIKKEINEREKRRKGNNKYDDNDESRGLYPYT